MLGKKGAPTIVAVTGSLLLLLSLWRALVYRDPGRQAEKTARADVATLVLAAEIWARSHDACPSLEGLEEAGIVAHVAEDPWGSRYRIDCDLTGDGFTVRSLGEDLREGTADDVTARGEEIRARGAPSTSHSTRLP